MSWTAYSNTSFNTKRKKTKINLRNFGNAPYSSMDNVNMMQALYKGRQDRLQRYRTYDEMFLDSDIARAMDIVAEHCTNLDAHTGFPFEFDYATEDPTREESVLLDENMKQWMKLNDFGKKLFRDIRSVLKYGDWFYFRNPKTFELYDLHPKLVLGALVDNENMEVLGWVVRDFKFNVEDMEINSKSNHLRDYLTSLTQGSGFQNAKIIPAQNVIHLTLSAGKLAGGSSDDDQSDMYSSRWPFGESYLEQIYKTYTQRQLLEDAALIHRVQRAPTRRVWYIDCGKMRPDRANWTIQNFKNELNQKRVPTQIGQGGHGSVDTVYNPQSQLEDYYIPVTSDSRGSKVENLEGMPWNDLPDLKYFTLKMLRALRVPYSFLVGPEEGGSVFSDGKVGTAYMQEIEFAQFCRRIQVDVESEFDFEFKMYLKIRNVNINAADFELKMTPPTNWEADRQRSRDQENIGTWMQVKDLPWISQRFAAVKYGGWSEDDLTENEQMKLEEDSQSNEDMGGAAGAGMGGMGGLGGLGGGMVPGMDGLGGGDGSLSGAPGGLGGGMSSGGAPGAAGGGMSGGAAGGGFGEGVEMTGTYLMEDEITLGDLEPVEHKLKDEGTWKGRTPKDELFGAKDPIKGDKIVTLKMIRDIRIAHLERRIENSKRLKVISKVYAKPPEAAGVGAF